MEVNKVGSSRLYDVYNLLKIEDRVDLITKVLSKSVEREGRGGLDWSIEGRHDEVIDETQ